MYKTACFIFISLMPVVLNAQGLKINSPTDLAVIIRQASQAGSQSSGPGFSSPMVDAETARSMSYDNDVKQARSYYERKLEIGRMRDQVKQERLARTQRNAAARRKRQLAQRRDPEKLSSRQLDREKGQISWPVPLRKETFKQDRDKVDALYPKHLSSGGGVNTEEYGPLQETLKKLKADLLSNHKKIQAQQYAYSRKFLDSFAFELRYPNGR